MKEIKELNWKPRWVSHLGCLQGCLDYLDLGLSDAWLFGVSGHAFIINIHEEVCPSGPTAWNTERMLALCRNVGCSLDVVTGHKSQDDFRAKQKAAWDKVRAAIDKGTPCYGWELEIPEFYVVYGYDDTGYYFRGPLCDAGKGPFPWQKLADTGIGALEIVAVGREKAAPVERTVKEALSFAVEHSRNPDTWVFPRYRTGLTGYDLWIEALRGNRAGGFGVAYNAAVWAECRRYAQEFLCEVRERLDGSVATIVGGAIASYGAVSKQLSLVAEAFPFHGVSDEQKKAHVQDAGRRTSAIDALQAARRSEEQGLKALTEIAGML